MAIFIVKYTKRKHLQDKLVNFMISEDILSLISMYALANGQTVSNVLRQFCVRNLNDTKVSAQLLIEQLSSKAQKEWDEDKSDIIPAMVKDCFQAFKAKVKNELIQKNIRPLYIEEIIKKIKQ